jgi:hypothetical protein
MGQWEGRRERRRRRRGGQKKSGKREHKWRDRGTVTVVTFSAKGGGDGEVVDRDAGAWREGGREGVRM